MTYALTCCYCGSPHIQSRGSEDGLWCATCGTLQGAGRAMLWRCGSFFLGWGRVDVYRNDWPNYTWELTMVGGRVTKSETASG